MKVGIVGAGAWGTALGIITVKSGANVVLWSYDGEYKKFDGVDLPQNITVTKNIESLSNCDVWLVATPAAYFRETMKKVAEFYNNQSIIICTKGAECATGEFMSEILTSVLPDIKDFGVLSGPQFAAEVAKGVPTGSTLAGTQKTLEIGRKVLKLLYLNETNDVIGAEICGVGKNAVALICGYNFIASAGENERAMIFTRAWNEVTNIGIALGAKINTFLDLCGIGDLFLSATSATSRNFSGGMAIAKGEKPNGTVEGIFALCGLIERAEKIGIDIPILKEMKIKLNI